MKSPTNEPTDPLKDALKTWQVDKTLPLGFEQQVWRRIETANRSHPSIIAEWFSEIVMGFRVHRAFTVGFVAVCLLVGIGMGMIQAHRATDAARLNLSERYVQSIDPYLRSPH